MKSKPAFAGIDVACAKRKSLPVNVSVLEGGALTPLPLRTAAARPPRGAGNVRALDPKWVAEFADETAKYLHDIEREFDVRINRIAIDAPSDPKPDGVSRRASELSLDARGISCFATPSEEEFSQIRRRARVHLKDDGREAFLPHANQIWMLVGFGLFKRLREDWGQECLEVYPQATASVLGCSKVHKGNEDGLLNQLRVGLRVTRCQERAEIPTLRIWGYGKPHDALDAFLAAWVASLPEDKREALGTAPSDTIWIPRISA